MNLKKIWHIRFQGWPWLFLPSLIGFSTALLAMILGFIAFPNPRELIVTILIVIFTLILNIIAMTQIGRPLSRLVDAARNLNQGRKETRANTDAPGVTGNLATQLNQLGAKLLQDQDQIDAAVSQGTLRLRRDSSTLQEQHLELRRSLAQALKAVEAQNELFSNLSHELRTPLTAILGYTDLLRRSKLDHEQQSHLATLDKSAQGMLGMINNLLDWGRIEAGRLSLNEDVVDVLEIVEGVSEMLSALAYEKNLELVRVVYHDVPRQVRGDGQRLRQIITNLMSNAIKFTTRGEVVLRVMRDRAEGGRVWLSFSVSDTGPGISDEQQRRLFQPFQQTAGTRGGSGLGLTITRKLAELMGGRVDMQSTLGDGSTFGVVIPFKLVQAQDSRLVESSTSPLREFEAWVMEPHPVARLALNHWLEHWQLKVRSFDTVPLLYSALTQAKPDIIILGLNLDDARHPDYLALMQRCAVNQPPLLALVSSASYELQMELRKAGAAGALTKSAGHQALFTEISKLMKLTAVPQMPFAGQRVLIADNNLTNRHYIAALCREMGMQVTEVGDGQEALDHWRREGAEVVLLDARMPKMDGLSCTRAMRAEDPGKRSRILAISANLEPEERKAFLAAGAEGVLIKPFESRELLRLLAPREPSAVPTSKKLTTDPQMLKLLREELPLQLQQLEDALQRRDLPDSLNAAHQLRGTAAFYHIVVLKQTTTALEEHLKKPQSLDNSIEWATLLGAVRTALHTTLKEMEKT